MPTQEMAAKAEDLFMIWAYYKGTGSLCPKDLKFKKEIYLRDKDLKQHLVSATTYQELKENIKKWCLASSLEVYNKRRREDDEDDDEDTTDEDDGAENVKVEKVAREQVSDTSVQDAISKAANGILLTGPEILKMLQDPTVQSSMPLELPLKNPKVGDWYIMNKQKLSTIDTCDWGNKKELHSTLKGEGLFFVQCILFNA